MRPSLSCNVTLATLFALLGTQQVLQPELQAVSPALALVVPHFAAFLNSVVVGKMMDNHNKPAQDADELLRNGYLTRAIGRTIKVLTEQLANEKSQTRNQKALLAFAKTLPNAWVELLQTPEAVPSLLHLQDTQIPAILSGAAGQTEEPIFLDGDQWTQILNALQRQKTQKPPLDEILVKPLGFYVATGFIHALRQILTHDDTESAIAFRRLTLDFFADISRRLSDIDATIKRTEQNTQALLTDAGDLLLQNDAIKANTDRIVAMLEKELAVKNSQISFLMNQVTERQVPSEKAVALAEQIPADAGNYALARKATAESRFDDARQLFRAAEEDKEVELARLYDADATNEFFALRYNDAVNYAKKAAVLSPDNAEYQENLGKCLHYAGCLDEAQVSFKKALAIREETLGLKHPDTATSVNLLGFLYRAQGKLDEAEPLYRRALAVREEVLGPKHPDTAISVNNLASLLYYSQGKLNEAEPLYLRGLAISEEVLGPKHYQTAVSLNNLAALCHSQGKLNKAGILYARALAIFEEVSGPETPIQHCA